MREKYEAMGNEMIRSLGFENKKVILFWKAFEEERWLACELHYKCFKKGLTKQSTPGIIIIESEREVNKMKNVVEISKRSKKEQKAYYAMQRGVNGFNTGTRTMKTAKSPTRAMLKDWERKGKEF